jgi:hypothetical protein
MPGTIPGRVFKRVISAVVESPNASAVGHLVRRVAEMEPDARYSWDDYTDMMQTLAAKLPADALVDVGHRVIMQGQETIRAGFTGEQVMKDWGTLFNSSIHGAPARDLVRTESFESGRVSVVAGVAQPARIVEGYVRGVVDMFGLGQVTSCEITPVIIGGSSYHRLVLQWR